MPSRVVNSRSSLVVMGARRGRRGPITETWRTATVHVEHGHRSRRDIALYEGYGRGEKHA